MSLYTATKGIIFFDIPPSDEREEEDFAKIELFNGKLKYASVINRVLHEHGVGANKMAKVMRHDFLNTIDVSRRIHPGMSLYDFEKEFEFARKKDIWAHRLKRLIDLKAPEEIVNATRESLESLEMDEPDFRGCFYFARVRNQPVKLFVRDIKFLLHSVFYGIDGEFWDEYNDFFGEEYQYNEGLGHALIIDTIFEEAKIELRLESKVAYFESKIPDNCSIAVSESLVPLENTIPTCEVFFKNKESLKNISMERLFEDAKAQHSNTLLERVADIFDGDEVDEWTDEYRRIVRKNIREQMPHFERFL